MLGSRKNPKPEKCRRIPHVRWSGKEVTLLPLLPLRTHRAPFNAIGSSISKALLDEETRQYKCTDFTIIGRSNQALLLMDAPARPKSAVICFPMSRSFVHFFRDEIPAGSLPLFRCGKWQSGGLHEPLSMPLQHSLRFLQHPYPLRRWLVLRPPYPEGTHRAYPVPLVYQSGLGSISTPGELHLR